MNQVMVENYPITSETDQELADEFVALKLNNGWKIAGMSTTIGSVLLMTVLYHRESDMVNE